MYNDREMDHGSAEKEASTRAKLDAKTAENKAKNGYKFLQVEGLFYF